MIYNKENNSVLREGSTLVFSVIEVKAVPVKHGANSLPEMSRDHLISLKHLINIMIVN